MIKINSIPALIELMVSGQVIACVVINLDKWKKKQCPMSTDNTGSHGNTGHVAYSNKSRGFLVFVTCVYFLGQEGTGTG